MQFRQEKKLSSACDLFVQLLEEKPESKIVLGMLSTCYFELEQYELAAKHAQRSVIVSPKSEVASLILFHSLWHIEQYDEAFDEMRRFMTLTSSAAYDELLQDLNKNLS